MAEYIQESPEVLYIQNEIVSVSKTDVQDLLSLAASNDRKRIRLCTHASVNDQLHEMIIVHPFGTYVRPHKHIGKPESFHVIEGQVDVVVFNDNGSVNGVIRLGQYDSGLDFYYRLASSLFHTIIIRSKVTVFHEVTSGPFVRSETVFGPWSPSEDNSEECSLYLIELHRVVSAQFDRGIS